jgi:hypothetical protein
MSFEVSVAQKWFELVSEKHRELKLPKQKEHQIKRDLEGGISFIPIVKISAGYNFYEFCGHPGTLEGVGSLTGTCVHPEYIGMETFQKALGGEMLPMEKYLKVWPRSIKVFDDVDQGWGYKFRGCNFNWSGKQQIPETELGFMLREGFEELFPKLTEAFDKKYIERLKIKHSKHL